MCDEVVVLQKGKEMGLKEQVRWTVMGFDTDLRSVLEQHQLVVPLELHDQVVPQEQLPCMCMSCASNLGASVEVADRFEAVS